MNQKWRNRIVGYGEENPDQLAANPKNWRIHPQAQQEALMGVIDEVGFVQNIIVNKTTGFVLDGHLRCALALRTGQKSIPATYAELNEQEEEYDLATLDRIGAKAGTDKHKLDDIVSRIQTENPSVLEMLQSLIKSNASADYTLEELDMDKLPDFPQWILITVPMEKLPEVIPFVKYIELVEGVQVEQSNR
mgnify:CR=1 FL=1